MPNLDSQRARQYHFGRSCGYQTGVTPVSEAELRRGRRPKDSASASRHHLFAGGRKLGSWSPDAPNDQAVVRRN